MSTLEDDDLLAAEYVLGTLPLEDRATAERRLREPAFAAAVAAWEARLAPLNDDYTLAPAPDLMPRIEARLFPQAPARRGFLAWGAALAGTLAVGAWLGLRPLPVGMTAELTSDQGFAWQASLTGSRLTITQTGGAPATSAQSHELWLIVGEAPPVSLGLIGQTTTVTLAEAPEGALLAVSLEPAGGSPTGQPTGPVLAAGPLTKA